MEDILKDFAQAISPALTELIKGVLLLLVWQIVAWVKAKSNAVKASMTTDQQWWLESLAGTAVKAAQQLYDDNEQKRDYAFDYIERELKKVGLEMDVDSIWALIEAEVYRQFKNKSE
jgi:hypothetical protein